MQEVALQMYNVFVLVRSIERIAWVNSERVVLPAESVLDLQIQKPLPVQQVCCCEANCMGRPPVDLRQWPPLFVCRHNVLAFENATRSRVACILFGKEDNVSFDECPCGIIWSVGETFVLCLRGLVHHLGRRWPVYLPRTIQPREPLEGYPWRAEVP